VKSNKKQLVEVATKKPAEVEKSPKEDEEMIRQSESPMQF